MRDDALAIQVERRIYLIRGQKVMLDPDLTALYGVPVKVLNQAVRRNINRFPSDFLFHLNQTETKGLRSQIVTLDDAEKKYGAQFKIVFDAIRELMTPPEKPRRRIGFHS